MTELGGVAGGWLVMVDAGGGQSWSVKRQRLFLSGAAPPVHLWHCW
jgi:hypothetical protein